MSVQGCIMCGTEGHLSKVFLVWLCRQHWRAIILGELCLLPRTLHERTRHDAATMLVQISGRAFR